MVWSPLMCLQDDILRGSFQGLRWPCASNLYGVLYGSEKLSGATSALCKDKDKNQCRYQQRLFWASHLQPTGLVRDATIINKANEAKEKKPITRGEGRTYANQGAKPLTPGVMGDLGQDSVNRWRSGWSLRLLTWKKFQLTTCSKTSWRRRPAPLCDQRKIRMIDSD